MTMFKNILLTSCLVLGLGSVVLGQVIHFAPHAGKGGKATASTCVLVDDEGTVASVVELQSDPAKAVLHVKGEKIPLKFLVSNPESRVALYRLPEASKTVLGKPVAFASSVDLDPADVVYPSKVDRDESARVVGRVHRFQGKVLPLAVLRLNHQGKAPAVGTGIFNQKGQLVAVVRQSVYNSMASSYALPAEVITRIAADYTRNSRVSRCWIGIIMDELVASPIVESVRPDSPASKAGLKKGDVILTIGGRKVDEYAHVVDAFYYLIAGETKKFKVLRGAKVMEFDVTPEVSPGR